MHSIPYTQVSKLVKQIDDLNDTIKYLNESSAVILQRKPPSLVSSSVEQGMRLTGTNAEIALFAMLREFTGRRDNLVDQLSGRAINVNA